jgi:ferritin-like metal-binding protein YciE
MLNRGDLFGNLRRIATSEAASITTGDFKMSETERPRLYNTRTFFITGLRNAHAMETQAIQILTRQVERLDSYPDMEAAIRRHITESEQQRVRLQDVLDALGESHASVKDAALGFVGNLMALAHVPASDEVIKDTLANYAFEHFEIAAYKTLITVGEALGESAAVAAAKSNLIEEERMASWIHDHMSATTLQFMALAEGGQQASH